MKNNEHNKVREGDAFWDRELGTKVTVTDASGTISIRPIGERQARDTLKGPHEFMHGGRFERMAFPPGEVAEAVETGARALETLRA